MVCCFAVLWYGCTHKSLIKIGCTRDCAAFCKPRETLLVAQSPLDCEVCVKAENERERQRQTHKHRRFRETELPKIPARTSDVKDERERADVERELRRSLFARQERAVKVMEEGHEDREYKTDCAEQWTNDYAENIWQLKYAECEDAAGFEADLLEMKNDREHCEEFGWSVVRESRWDADYAEESDDRIVPLIGSGITATSKTTDPSPENAASISELAPAAPMPSMPSFSNSATGPEKQFVRPRADAAASIAEFTGSENTDRACNADAENVRDKAPVATAFVCTPSPIAKPNLTGSGTHPR